MSVKYPKRKWQKTLKILISFGQILFKTPCFSKILDWTNPNQF